MTATHSLPARTNGQALETVSHALTALTIVLALGLSALMLARLGIAYEVAGGPAWQKIHPATPVAILAFAALAFSRGNPFWLVEDILMRQPGAIAFLAMLVVMIAYIVWRGGGPVTQFVDTFILPWMLFVLLTRWPDSWRLRMALALHVFMAINAILGISEFALGFRITPLISQGEVLTQDWRSTSLLGHPLLNAAATASYAYMLLIGGGRDLPMWARASVLVLQLAAMIVFGGRVATVMFAIFAIPTLAIAMWRFRGAYRMTPAQAGLLVLAIVAAATAVSILISEGFFDRFVERFIDDGGSALARASMFDLVAALPADMLWFGSDPDYIASLQIQYGIPFGIESFWVSLIASQGILLSVPFFALYLMYMNEYRRALVPGTLWSIVLFLLIISTSTSLSSKTAMLTVYTIAACLLLRPSAQRER